MLEVSLAHAVGALKKYLDVTSKQSTSTRARQTQRTIIPVYSLMLSITRTMVLILVIYYSPAPSNILGAGLNLASELTKIVRCIERPGSVYAQGVSYGFKRTLGLHYLGKEGVSG